MSKILFTIRGKPRTLGMGDIAMLACPVYFRGRSLGYDEVYLEWPNIVTGPKYKKVRCPKKTIIPVNFIKRSDIRKKDFDEILDLRDKHVLFNFYPGIDLDTEGKKTKSLYGIYNFNNLYLYSTGIKPVFKVDKDKLEKPYIIIHHRNYKTAQFRNSKEETTKIVLDLLRDTLGDKYEIWKMGEPTSFDEEFDRVTTINYNDVNEYFKTINNSSMVLGNGQSGITATGNYFDIPVVRLDVNFESKISRNLLSVYHWSALCGVGYTCYDWAGPEKNRVYYVNKFGELELENLEKFVIKWLL